MVIETIELVLGNNESFFPQDPLGKEGRVPSFTLHPLDKELRKKTPHPPIWTIERY